MYGAGAGVSANNGLLAAPVSGGGTSSNPEEAGFAFSSAAEDLGAGFDSASFSSFTNEASTLAAEGFQPESCADGATGAGVSARPGFDEPPALNADSTGPEDADEDDATGVGSTMTGRVGRGASTDASSVASESGIQSLKPARQHRLSGPTSALSQCSFTFSMVSGPTCFSSMATNHSCEAAGLVLPASASASLRTASLASDTADASSCAGPSPASPGGTLCEPELSTWSNTAPISSSSTPPKMPPSGGVPKVAGRPNPSLDWPWDVAEPLATSPAVPSSFADAEPAERTTMLWPHFLQRTLTPLAPTLSSLIEYCARQLSQTKRIVPRKSQE